MTRLQAPSRQADVTVRVAFSWSVGTDHLTGTHQAMDRGTFSVMTLSVDGPMRSPPQGGFFPQLLLISPPLCSLRTLHGPGAQTLLRAPSGVRVVTGGPWGSLLPTGPQPGQAVPASLLCLKS